MIATDEGPIGVDLERIVERDLRAAERLFTDDELRWMRGGSAAARFEALDADEPSGFEKRDGDETLGSEALDAIASTELERFYVLWTRKESVMKFFGIGLGLDPRSFDTLSDSHGGAIELRGESLRVKSYRLGDYVYSVCRLA